MPPWAAARTTAWSKCWRRKRSRASAAACARSSAAQTLVAQGAFRVIVGTAAFTADGPEPRVPRSARDAIGRERIVLALDSKDGRIVVKGWQEATHFTAEEVIQQLEPYCSGFLCTYVDKEGMMQGTDLDWFRRLRAATELEITAAGGITTLDDIRALDRDGHPRRGRHGDLHGPPRSGRTAENIMSNVWAV